MTATQHIDVVTLDRFSRMATSSLPKESIWKIHLEIASVCEKKEDFTLAKRYLVASVRTAQESLKWRPLMAIAKLELL